MEAIARNRRNVGAVMGIGEPQVLIGIRIRGSGHAIGSILKQSEGESRTIRDRIVLGGERSVRSDRSRSRILIPTFEGVDQIVAWPRWRSSAISGR